MGLAANSDARLLRIRNPRVYYHAEKTQGEVIETSGINLKIFDFILDEAGSAVYENVRTSEMRIIDGTLELVYPEISPFAYTTIRRDNIPYQSDEGNFYLPDAIIFYDKGDYPYPTEYYFLARIDGKLQLRQCAGGEDVQWFETADRHEDTKAPAIIIRVEKTLEQLSERISHELEEKMEKERAKKEKDAERKPASPGVKAAYTELLNICMPQSERKILVQDMIGELKEYDEEDEDYCSTFDFFLYHHLNSALIPFFIVIDWKTSINELNEWVHDAVKENFGQTVDFLKDGEPDEDLIVSDEEGFPSFDKKLGEIGLQFSFVDTGNDEYVFIIHPKKDLNRVKQAFSVLGFTWQSVADL